VVPGVGKLGPAIPVRRKLLPAEAEEELVGLVPQNIRYRQKGSWEPLHEQIGGEKIGREDAVCKCAAEAIEQDVAQTSSRIDARVGQSASSPGPSG
jgi:hypothetical protein